MSSPQTQPDRASIKHARRMRKELTPPEARLWSALRGQRLADMKFRRQHPIGPFIVDFYCHGARLAVEVDGIQHDLGDSPARDNRRDIWLEHHGVSVLRVPASAVKDNLDGVLALIEQTARYSGPT